MKVIIHRQKKRGSNLSVLLLNDIPSSTCHHPLLDFLFNSINFLLISCPLLPRGLTLVELNTCQGLAILSVTFSKCLFINSLTGLLTKRVSPVPLFVFPSMDFNKSLKRRKETSGSNGHNCEDGTVFI